MCSVVGCESSRRGAPRFLLPEDPERRLQWVQFLLEVNGMQLKESSWTDIAVCSEHFPGESFVGAGQLSPAAVPSVSIKQEPEEAAWSPDDTDLAASLFEDVKPFENSLSFLEESKPTFDDDASSRSVQPAQKAPTTVSNNIAALLQMEGYYVVNEKCLFELVARSCPSCGSKLQLEKVSYDVILVLKRRCLKCGYKSQWQNLPGASIQEVRRPTEETKATSEDQQLKERCSDDNQWQHRPGAGIQTPEDRSPTEETEDPSEDQQLKQRCSDENQWQNGPGAGIQTPEDRSPTEETEDPLEDQQLSTTSQENETDLRSDIGTDQKCRRGPFAGHETLSEDYFSDETELSGRENRLRDPMLVLGEFSNPSESGIDDFNSSTSSSLLNIFAQETELPGLSREENCPSLDEPNALQDGELPNYGASEEDHKALASSLAIRATPDHPSSSLFSEDELFGHIGPEEESCEADVRVTKVRSVDFTQTMKGRMKVCAEKNLKVTIKMTQRNEFGRVWDKAHYCLYCKKANMKIARHLQRKHSDEADVARAYSYPPGSKQRRMLLESLRNRGDCRHNFEVLERGSGEIITWKQPSKKVSIKDYVPCQHCFAMFKKTDMWRHKKSCRNVQGEKGRGRKVHPASSQLLTQSSSGCS